MTAAKPFSIASLELDGTRFPAVIDGDSVHDIGNVVPGIHTTADLLAEWDANLDEIASYLAAGRGKAESLSELRAAGRVRFLPPMQPVGSFIAAGANYREHIIQMSVAHKLGSEGASEEQLRAEAAREVDRRGAAGDPYVWAGLPSAASGAYDDVQLPDVGSDIDWETELGVVIARTASRVAPADAHEYVAGYTIVNDITARSLVPRDDMAKMGTDWFRSKNHPTFFPTGPVVLPARFVADPAQLRIRLWLNGEVKQDATGDDMVFDVPSLIAYASSVATLQPGDILITGSPAGNGSHWKRFLRDGDVMEATITGLGTQRTLVRGPSGVRPPWQSSRR